MIEGLKICGISDPKTLNYVLNHPNPPKFIGFITNYTKSKRFVKYEVLKVFINRANGKNNIGFITFLSIFYNISFIRFLLDYL